MQTLYKPENTNYVKMMYAVNYPTSYIKDSCDDQLWNFSRD